MQIEIWIKLFSKSCWFLNRTLSHVYVMKGSTITLFTLKKKIVKIPVAISILYQL